MNMRLGRPQSHSRHFEEGIKLISKRWVVSQSFMLKIIFPPMAHKPLVSQGLHIIEASWSQSVRHTTLGRIPLAERSARREDLYLTTHNTQKRQTSPSGIQTRNPRKRAATHPRPRRRAHWDWLLRIIKKHESILCVGRVQDSLMLQQVVHIVTTGLINGLLIIIIGLSEH